MSAGARWRRIAGGGLRDGRHQARATKAIGGRRSGAGPIALAFIRIFPQPPALRDLDRRRDFLGQRPAFLRGATRAETTKGPGERQPQLAPTSFALRSTTRAFSW